MLDNDSYDILNVKSKYEVPYVLWSNKRNLNFPKEIIIGCILRGEQSLIPRGDTRLMEGDILLIITSDKTKMNLVKEMTEYEVS